MDSSGFAINVEIAATIPFSIPSLLLPHIVDDPFPGPVQGRDSPTAIFLNAQGAPFCLWQPCSDVAGPCAHNRKRSSPFHPGVPAKDPQTTADRAPALQRSDWVLGSGGAREPRGRRIGSRPVGPAWIGSGAHPANHCLDPARRPRERKLPLDGAR